MDAAPDDRQYNPIWKRLKAEKKVSVAVPLPLHDRIIKAVTKEKWLDLEYKLQIEPRTATMRHSVKGAVITFRLYISLPPVITPTDF